jgi:hypothetical protein
MTTTIPTWNQLPTARGACEGVASDEPNTFTLRWSFELDGDEVAQEVTATEIHTFGESWLVMTAVVGRASETVRARRNQQLLAGRFGTRRGEMVISHAVPADALSTVEIERLLGIIAFEAARVRYCA